MKDKIIKALKKKPLTIQELSKKLGFCCWEQCVSRYNLSADVIQLVDFGVLEIIPDRRIKLRV